MHQSALGGYSGSFGESLNPSLSLAARYKRVVSCLTINLQKDLRLWVSIAPNLRYKTNACIDFHVDQFNVDDWLADNAFDAQSDQPSAQDSPGVSDTPDLVPASRELHSNGPLPLLRLADWNKDATYDEHPPICIYYSIEWKLTVNSKAVSRDIEPNLVLAPSAFWSTLLRQN